MKRILRVTELAKRGRTALLGAGGMLVLAAAVFASSGMWSASAARADTATSTEPVISSVSVVPSSTSATVMWMTDEAANSWVAYGTTTPYAASTTLDSATTTSHSEVLSGLSPATTYHYAVISMDGNGSTTTSPDATFMTAAATSTASTTPLLMLSATSGMPGDSVSATGSGFSPLETVTLTDNASSTSSASSTSTTADANGDFSTMWTVPWVAPANVSITATGATSGIAAMNVFTVLATATSTASTTPVLMLGTSSGMPGSSVTITGSGFAPLETVMLMANGTSTSVIADANGGFSTTWTVPSVGAGNLTITATGDTSNAAASSVFNVTAATSGGGGGDTSTLQAEITQLQNEVTALQTQVTALLANMQGGGGSTGPVGNTPASIDQNGQSVSLGSGIDFGGHNFGDEETVLITMNGQTVGSAHADGGGNFSTGSMSLPATAGTYTYQFVGQNSGKSANATITVH